MISPTCARAIERDKDPALSVFICHSHTDAPLAARVRDELQLEGFDIRHPDIHLPGDNWAAKAGRALEESDAMVLLWTPAATDSPHVAREIGYALGARNYSNRLVPVAVGDAVRDAAKSAPWILRRMRWARLDDHGRGVPVAASIAEALRDPA